jgi:hypothetical protein
MSIVVSVLLYLLFSYSKYKFVYYKSFFMHSTSHVKFLKIIIILFSFFLKFYTLLIYIIVRGIIKKSEIINVVIFLFSYSTVQA